MRVWVDFFFFIIKFCFFFYFYFFIVFIIFDLFYIIAVPIEDDDEDEFIDIMSEYGIDVNNMNSDFDLNYSERHLDRDIFMCALIDKFNNNYIFPLYNYFYPSRDPEYSLFFDSKWGTVVGLLEFAIEDIGTDMIYAGSLIIRFFKYIVSDL